MDVWDPLSGPKGAKRPIRWSPQRGFFAARLAWLAWLAWLASTRLAKWRSIISSNLAASSCPSHASLVIPLCSYPFHVSGDKMNLGVLTAKKMKVDENQLKSERADPSNRSDRAWSTASKLCPGVSHRLLSPDCLLETTSTWLHVVGVAPWTPQASNLMSNTLGDV